MITILIVFREIFIIYKFGQNPEGKIPTLEYVTGSCL